MATVISVEKIAESLHSSKLPYHNFQHAMAVLEWGRQIAHNYETTGLPVDHKVIEYATLFHDAGYQENSQTAGFETKEAYSAHLAGVALKDSDTSPSTIQRIQAAILATHRDAEPQTLEEKIVRAADIASLAGNYEQFLTNTINLQREYEILTGKKQTWEEAKMSAKAIIEYYSSQQIELYPGDEEFAEHSQRNLQRLMREPDPK